MQIIRETYENNMIIDAITLQCFIVTCETKNITKTAKIIGRTQSAVSQQLKKLEEYLSVSLFTRGKKFALTNNGQIFLNYARQMYALQLETLDRFKNPELTGEISFGVPEDFANLYITDILAHFNKIHPRILLRIECDLTINLFEKFKNNSFDLVLVKMNSPKDFPNGVNVWSEPLQWVGNPKILKNNAQVPLVLAPEPCVYRESAIKALAQHNISWRLAFSSNSYNSNVAAVKADMGITVMPGTLINNSLQQISKNLMPALPDLHISLLKKNASNNVVDSLEEFILAKLHPNRS